MARAIDADDLIRIASEKKVSELFPNWKELSSETRNAVGAFGQYWKELIEDAPTIDPVKHGKWVYKPTSDYDGYIVCSICNVYIPSHKLFGKDDEYTNTSIYCPHCGARMDGE